MKEKNKDVKKDDKRETPQVILPETLSTKMTRWIGTPASLFVHTIFFIGIFVMHQFGVPFDQILLILTTVVSLEAIYLAIFIQITINRQEEKLHEVREEIEEISEDIEDIHEDVEELGEDFDEISEDISEIQEDVEELGKDFDEISDDMEEDEKKEEVYRSERNKSLQKM